MSSPLQGVPALAQIRSDATIAGATRILQGLVSLPPYTSEEKRGLLWHMLQERIGETKPEFLAQLEPDANLWVVAKKEFKMANNELNVELRKIKQKRQE